MFLASACRGTSRVEETGQADLPELSVWVEFPSLQASKAEDLPGYVKENTIHSLSLWVFDSRTHECIVSKDFSSTEFPAQGGVRRYDFPVTDAFAQNPPKVDVYVLANGASAGVALNADSSWEQVDGALVQGTYFGLAQPQTEVPEGGLPMSGTGKGLTVLGGDPAFSLDAITLLRAVSKIRFVFSQMETEGFDPTDVSVTRVTLSGNQIPLSERLFTTAAPDISASYDPDIFSLSGEGITIGHTPVPENFIWVNQEPAAYQALLDQAVLNGRLTDLGTVYFRESDKRLQGTIHYKLSGIPHSASFSMSVPGDFVRNHSWTVYGYFVSNHMIQLALSAMSWDKNEYTVDFSRQAAVVNSRFTLQDTEGLADVIWKGSDAENHDYYDVRMAAGATIKGRLQITAPRGGHLMVEPDGDAWAFDIDPEIITVDPTRDAGVIEVKVRKNPDYSADDTSGRQVTLRFYVETSEDGGERTIDLHSEMLNVYTFILP